MTGITITKTGEDQGSKALQVTVPVDRVRAAEERAIRYYASRIRMPGFRRGKVPPDVVRKRFSEEIRRQVLQDVIREGWDAAREAEDLKPIADPSVRNLKFETGQPVEFELVVEIKPDVTLARTGQFTLTRTVESVAESQVGEQLDRLREQRATWLPVGDGRPAPGHLVQGEVAPIEDGKVHAPKPFTMVLGEGQAIPDLEERIMEMAPGEVREADVRFPDDYPDESRRGQVRRVRITLAEVKRKELPTLDDDFAREMGDFETLDALREVVRRDLQRDAERMADARTREDLIGLVAEANNVVPPPSLVERALHALGHAYGIPEERYPEFAAQFRPIAAQQVRRDMIISAVAEQQQLRATEAELDDRMAAIAQSRSTSPAEVYKSLEQAKRLPELERSITEEKVFDFLLSQSTVTEAGA